MGRWLKYLTIIVTIIVVALVVAQFVRTERANPTTDPRHTIEAQMGKTHAMVAVLDRACRDCHSNETRWPSYAKIAPLSWLMSYVVKEGRTALNFSEWTGYPPDAQQALLVASCEDVSKGKMPGGAWIYLHPEARLSPQDIETICATARQAKAQ